MITEMVHRTKLIVLFKKVLLTSSTVHFFTPSAKFLVENCYLLLKSVTCSFSYENCGVDKILMISKYFLSRNFLKAGISLELRTDSISSTASAVLATFIDKKAFQIKKNIKGHLG